MHSFYGNLSGSLVGEMKHAGGDAAKRDALHAVLPGQLQTGTVAGGQQALILRGYTAIDNGADGVQHIVAGQIVSLGNFGLPGRLFMTLAFHELSAVQSELYARKGMDAVVDAGVARHIAARHAAVCGVDNGTALEPGDVALPEVEVAANRLQIGQAGDTCIFDLLTQVFVLYGQELSVNGLGAADVHQRTQHALLRIGIRRGFHAAISSLFVLRSQLGQDLLIAGLPAGDSVKVSAGIFADRHTLGSKCPADVAEVTLMLSRIKFVFSLHSLLGNQSSHINNPSNNLNVRLCVRSQVTRKLVLS